MLFFQDAILNAQQDELVTYLSQKS